jgi:Raf kinase inhibitor-like YbhB/YbcL family protein
MEDLSIGWRSTLCPRHVPNTSTMKFGSSNIEACGYIPVRFTCDDINIIPSFSWENVPLGVKSFVIIMDDPDAIPVSGGVHTHLAVVNLPANLRHLNENQNFVQIPSAVTLKNDKGTYGWSGPCPPKEDHAHTYRFTLYAMNTTLNIDRTQKLTVEIFERLFYKNILSRSSFNGKYKRK